MVNLLTFMEFANTNYFLLEEQSITEDLLHDLANRCGFRVITKRRKKGQVLYKLKKLGIPCERLYTREEKSTFNFIDIADLHIGNDECEVNKIRSVLDYAVSRDVDYVFVAGDVLDGIFFKAEPHVVNSILEKQLDMAVAIFKNYPLDIRVLPGNHDFTFDYMGIMNPLKKLEERLKGENCNFKVYDGYIQDFEIAGVIKRMMHLENFYFHDNVFSSIQRLHEFEKHGGLNVKCLDGVERPIRFLECGHIHKTVEIYNSDFNVYISQPGSFVKKQNHYMPFVHVKGEVLEDLRVVRG